jgi:magnesium-transporting ATPase (P-type)
MTASVQISTSILNKKKIYTLKSNKVVEGGVVKTVCFDKTGTLTELDIKVFGYLLRDKWSFETFSNKMNSFEKFETY